VEFALEAKVLVDGAYIQEKVKAAVEARLRDRFSFEARQLGQAVTLSETAVVIQNVTGVVAVDIDRLHRGSPDDTDEEASTKPKPAFVLQADPADLEQNKGAELLRLGWLTVSLMEK
jgi:hypothetical protein